MLENEVYMPAAFSESNVFDALTSRSTGWSG